ncbi:MAG: class I poly(R)-hydroxyalkanoic acid synthase, partial [Ferrovibrio sp.]
GHIAGVINHPDAKKYQHWRNDTKTNPPNVEDWIKGAKEYPGSWWDDWDAWLSEKSGEKVPARKPGDGKLKVIEPAPGSYVKKRIVD